MIKYYRKSFGEKYGPQIWLCLFMFRPITLKQLNSLTSIDIFSLPDGREVIPHTAARDVPGSVLGSGNGFLCLIFCFVVLLL